MAVLNSTHVFKTIRYTEDNVTTAAFTAIGDALTLTATVTGAVIGDVAVASLSALPSDISISANVPAADTVKVVLINGSGTTNLNLADTMDLVITVFKTHGET